MEKDTIYTIIPEYTFFISQFDDVKNRQLVAFNVFMRSKRVSTVSKFMGVHSNKCHKMIKEHIYWNYTCKFRNWHLDSLSKST
jgi:hypothetical protein